MAESMERTQLCVIGGGPGGYPAAFFAADQGLQVTLIDRETAPGGVCLYRGCIPSKTLLHAAKLILESREAKTLGLEFTPPKIDLDQLREFSQSVIGKLTGGLGVLAKKRKIRFLHGTAKLRDAKTVEVDLKDGGKTVLSCDHIIVATGSAPATVPGFPTQSPRIMDSTAALQIADIPKRLLVVGGGYIGLELSTVYAALGSRITVVEATPRLLNGVDRDLVEQVEGRLKQLFHEVLCNTKVDRLEDLSDEVRVDLVGLNLEDGMDRRFDKVLVAVGRKPRSGDVGLEQTRVKIDQRGWIVTDAQRRTDEPTIFAIGDVAGEPMLAHKATYEARVAVETIIGKSSAFDPAAIPAVVFTDPEVAWCGLTEEQARSQGIPHKVTRFPWAASGRAATLGRSDGLTKMILDPRSERILGVGICGVGAGELIAEGVLAVEMGAQATDLQLAIHAHPTLSETMMEAAELFHGPSAHVIPRA